MRGLGLKVQDPGLNTIGGHPKVRLKLDESLHEGLQAVAQTKTWQ